MHQNTACNNFRLRETSLIWNQQRDNLQWKAGGSRWGIAARERGNIGPHRGMQTVWLIGYGSSLGERLTGYENLYSLQPYYNVNPYICK